MEWYFIILIILSIVLLLFIIGGFIVHKFIYGRIKITKETVNKALDSYNNQTISEMIRNGIDWFNNKEKEEVTITSYDGLKLTGYYIENENKSHKTLILVHGWHSMPSYDFSCSSKIYYDQGYNLFYIDQRAHNKSEGTFSTFGIKERFDLKKWVEYLDNKFASKMEFILVGISMGSSTVMYTLNLDLPKSVKCALCDCGYSSPMEVLKHCIKQYGKIPWFPLAYFINLAMVITTGKSLTSISTKKTLSETNIPVLLIHGENDKMVPITMSEENYSYLKGEKEFKRVPKANHGISFIVDKEGYLETVNKFVQKYVD